MSSISFPNSSLPPRPSEESESESESFSQSDLSHSLASQYYTPSFDTSAFQMNPLSSHPPRTPRTSIMSASTMSTSGMGMYESAIYIEKEDAFNINQSFASHSSDRTHTQTPTQQRLRKDSQKSIKEIKVEHPEDDEEEYVEIDEEEERVKKAEQKVRNEDVWREMFVTSNGRDKAFKLIQYSIRVYLVFHLSLRGTRLLRRPTQPPWEEAFIKRLQSTASGLSFTRKLLLLFNWLHPLTLITAQQSVPFSAEAKFSSALGPSSSSSSKQPAVRPFLQTLLYSPPPVLLELVNAAADDIATWARLGLLGKKTGERAERFSDWCWFVSTLVGLVENSLERGVVGGLQAEVEGRLYTESMTGATAKSKPRANKIDEKELARLQKQDYWLQVTRAKLFMDLIFVSYELFHIKRARDWVKAFTGLSAAILSSSKLFDRHKNTLIKSMLKSSS
ncbi:hypothetical protein CVT24_001067 [Panaeolus cyanescens]|uniref:Uncharacterized protein n=1 Tax=Panaeolus cyanescens TaxID=181874 RepID=A0A409W784_9AGAR|nr:hypothetical protein CVT24_001067 [Panaeolus cyanescens]